MCKESKIFCSLKYYIGKNRIILSLFGEPGAEMSRFSQKKGRARGQRTLPFTKEEK